MKPSECQYNEQSLIEQIRRLMQNLDFAQQTDRIDDADILYRQLEAELYNYVHLRKLNKHSPST